RRPAARTRTAPSVQYLTGRELPSLLLRGSAGHLPLQRGQLVVDGARLATARLRRGRPGAGPGLAGSGALAGGGAALQIVERVVDRWRRTRRRSEISQIAEVTQIVVHRRRGASRCALRRRRCLVDRLAHPLELGELRFERGQ